MIYFLLCAAGMALHAAFIVTEHRERYVRAVILKGAASLLFA
jgi:hypothetical protein